MPVPILFTHYPARLAALILGSSLIATAGYSESESPEPASAAPSGTTLLAGSKPPAGDFNVTTGFRLTQNTILLDALPGSASSTESFVVDSGAPLTIAPSLARELSLEPLASIGLKGPEGGHLSVPVTRIPKLNIAGLEFTEVGAVVDWVEPPNQLACLSTAGLMGASLLQTAIWQIDFETSNITITNSLAGLEGLSKAMKIPFQRSDAAGSPRINVGVSDSDAVSLLLDLGFNGSIAIPVALLERAGDTISETAPTEIGQSSSTVFGAKSSQSHIATLSELRIGTLRLKDFPVTTGSAVSDFHVGIEFLRHFRVTVDWINDDLYLEPRHQTSALYPELPAYGFSTELRDGQLVVGAIWLDSAADKAGMKPGDQLVKIGKYDTKAADFATLCDMSNVVGLFGKNSAPMSVTWIHAGKQNEAVIAREPLLPQHGSDDS
jgi:predicted aspartyl protease